ncbi:hypothetical protein LCGC14_1070270 [marine sediment metagenome]|uniref:Uncharacterized protein n=1 Tax=marine sediment metagenome TaxID=412755 RepID=A0A0F9QPA9_9ZZZZ
MMEETITEIVPNGIMPERFNTITEAKVSLTPNFNVICADWFYYL